MTKIIHTIPKGYICPVCSATMMPDQPSWVYRCKSCGYLRSSLTPVIGLPDSKPTLNESRRETALETLRRENFERILNQLANISLPGKQLLDVGCAHGWFLEAAQRRQYSVYGIEPDPEMAVYAKHHGLNVQEGFFPDDLDPTLRFDIIIFNDVFEHLPDVTNAMQACYRLLNPGGIVVINLPVSSGIFYKSARILERIGIPGPFDRMWQRHFPSPHISYFQSNQFQRFGLRHGFTLIENMPLPSIEIRGLWSRLRYDTSTSIITSVLIYILVVIIVPMLNFLPADIRLHVFRKKL